MGAVAPDWMSAAQSAIFCSAQCELGGEWTLERLADLEQYACCRAVWMEAEADIAANGAVLILRNDKGEVKAAQASPYVRIASDSRKTMAQLWSRLCQGRYDSSDGPTTDQVLLFADAVRRGLRGSALAGSVGVSLEILRDWVRRGESGETGFVPLMLALDGGMDG